MKTELIIDILGWLGALAAVYAYFMVSTNQLKGDSTNYQVLNIIGAGFLIANSAFYGAMPSAIVNIIWIGVAGYSLHRSGALASGFRYSLMKKKKSE